MKKRELLKMAEDTGSKYIRLVNEDGDVVCPQNNPKHSLEARCETIEKILDEKSIYPNGTYTIELRPSSAGHPVKFKAYKGKNLSDEKKSTAKDTPFDAKQFEYNTRIAFLEQKLCDLEDLLSQEPDPEPINDTIPQSNPVNEIILGLIPLADTALKAWMDTRTRPLQDKPIVPIPKKQIAGFIASLLGEVMASGLSLDTAQAYIDSLKGIDQEIYFETVAIINSYAAKESA